MIAIKKLSKSWTNKEAFNKIKFVRTECCANVNNISKTLIEIEYFIKRTKLQ